MARAVELSGEGGAVLSRYELDIAASLRGWERWRDAIAKHYPGCFLATPRVESFDIGAWRVQETVCTWTVGVPTLAPLCDTLTILWPAGAGDGPFHLPLERAWEGPPLLNTVDLTIEGMEFTILRLADLSPGEMGALLQLASRERVSPFPPGTLD